MAARAVALLLESSSGSGSSDGSEEERRDSSDVSSRSSDVVGSRFGFVDPESDSATTDSMEADWSSLPPPIPASSMVRARRRASLKEALTGVPLKQRKAKRGSEEPPEPSPRPGASPQEERTPETGSSPRRTSPPRALRRRSPPMSGLRDPPSAPVPGVSPIALAVAHVERMASASSRTGTGVGVLSAAADVHRCTLSELETNTTMSTSSYHALDRAADRLKDVLDSTSKLLVGLDDRERLVTACRRVLLAEAKMRSGGVKVMAPPLPEPVDPTAAVPAPVRVSRSGRRQVKRRRRKGARSPKKRPRGAQTSRKRRSPRQHGSRPTKSLSSSTSKDVAVAVAKVRPPKPSSTSAAAATNVPKPGTTTPPGDGGSHRNGSRVRQAPALPPPEADDSEASSTDSVSSGNRATDSESSLTESSVSEDAAFVAVHQRQPARAPRRVSPRRQARSGALKADQAAGKVAIPKQTKKDKKRKQKQKGARSGKASPEPAPREASPASDNRVDEAAFQTHVIRPPPAKKASAAQAWERSQDDSGSADEAAFQTHVIRPPPAKKASAAQAWERSHDGSDSGSGAGSDDDGAMFDTHVFRPAPGPQSSDGDDDDAMLNTHVFRVPPNEARRSSSANSSIRSGKGCRLERKSEGGSSGAPMPWETDPLPEVMVAPALGAAPVANGGSRASVIGLWDGNGDGNGNGGASGGGDGKVASNGAKVDEEALAQHLAGEMLAGREMAAILPELQSMPPAVAARVRDRLVVLLREQEATARKRKKKHKKKHEHRRRSQDVLGGQRLSRGTQDIKEQRRHTLMPVVDSGIADDDSNVDPRGVERGPCSCGECVRYQRPMRGARCDYCDCSPTKHVRI